MKLSKITFAIFLFVFGFFALNINAQDKNSSRPKQIKILNNYGEIPFEDGKTVIAEVKFIGLDSDFDKYDESLGRRIPESEFLRAFREQRTNINAGEKFHGYKVSKIVKIMRERLSAKGYINAEVVAYGEMLPKNQMNLIFSVKRGLPAFVSEIRFEDNQNLTNFELVGKLKKCLGDKWKIFDGRHYDYCLHKNVRSYMFSKGYFQAEIRQVSPKLVANSYVINILVKEGTRFVYGDVEFKGASVFSEKQLFEIFGQKTGDVADGKLLQNFVFEKLKKEYGNKGYALYYGDFELEYIEPEAKGLEGAVNVSFNIWEGRQFNVESVKFIGISKEDEFRLREILSLKNGEPYNQSKLENGIQKINELKEFLPIDATQGVLISASEGYSGIEVITFDGNLEITLKTRRLTDNEREYYKELFSGFNPNLSQL